MYMPCLFNGIMAFSLIVERYDFSIFDSTFLLGKNLYNNEHVAIKLVSRNLLTFVCCSSFHDEIQDEIYYHWLMANIEYSFLTGTHEI